MLISQDDRSPGAIGAPKRAPSAESAGAAAQIIAAVSIAIVRAPARSSERIARLPFLVDPPARDGVVVILAAQPAFRHELRPGGLHAAGIVGGAALQDGGSSTPLPRDAKTRERLRQHRLLQDGVRPAVAALGGHLDLSDAALPRPGQSGDLADAGPPQCEPWRGMGD